MQWMTAHFVGEIRMAFDRPVDGIEMADAPAALAADVTTALEAAFPCGLEQTADSPAQFVLSPPPAHPNRPSHLYRRVQRCPNALGVRAHGALDSLTPVNRTCPSSTGDNPSRTVRAVTRGIFVCPAISSFGPSTPIQPPPRGA